MYSVNREYNMQNVITNTIQIVFELHLHFSLLDNTDCRDTFDCIELSF